MEESRLKFLEEREEQDVESRNEYIRHDPQASTSEICERLER
jgi:hypothetical protein